VPHPVSIIESLSARGRVRYGRFLSGTITITLRTCQEILHYLWIPCFAAQMPYQLLPIIILLLPRVARKAARKGMDIVGGCKDCRTYRTFYMYPCMYRLHFGISLVPRPHLSRGKWSGEPSWISWAYYRNMVRTNEIALLSIICSQTLKLQCAKAQDCFPVLAFDLIRERYVVATTSEATSCTQLC